MRKLQPEFTMFSPERAEKLRRFLSRYTEEPDEKTHLYFGMALAYTLLAIVYFLHEIIWGSAWTLLALVAWSLARLNWRRSRSIRRKGGLNLTHAYKRPDA